MMPRTVVFHQYGPPEVLQIENRPAQRPGRCEVLLNIHAIGVNRAESAYRQGRYLDVPREFPAKLGFEASGTIAAIGPDTEGFNVGDRVATLPIFSLRDYGVYADQAVVPAAALVRYPEALSPLEAASVWMSSLTAYGGLVFRGALQRGQCLVVTAASSSVGLAAIQTARYLGATVIATTRSPGKQELLRQAGADHVIVTTAQDITQSLDAITAGAGVDVCFDAVGGGNLIKLLKASSLGARIVVYGTLSTEPTLLPLSLSLQKCVAIYAYRNMDLVRCGERGNAERFIFDRLQEGAIRSCIDRVFPLSRVADAHAYLEAGTQFGKIVLTTDEGRG